jgi:hypothetical protein
MSQVIEVIVGKTGDTQISVRGVSGQGCQGLTKRLEANLGGLISSQATAEAFETDPLLVENKMGDD